MLSSPLEQDQEAVLWLRGDGCNTKNNQPACRRFLLSVACISWLSVQHVMRLQEMQQGLGWGLG